MDSTIYTPDKKYCFVADNDGHWYCIPVELKYRFNSLLDAYLNYDEDLDKLEDICQDIEHEFYCYRLKMHITNYQFTEPQEINKGL